MSEHRNAKLLILGGALEYQRVTNKLASIDTILEQVCTFFTIHLHLYLYSLRLEITDVVLVQV